MLIEQNNSNRRMYTEHRVQRELCVYLEMWKFLSLTKYSCTHVDKCWEVSPASTTFQLKIKEAIQTSPLTKVPKFLQWPLYLSERWVTWTQMTQPNLSKTRFLLTHFFLAIYCPLTQTSADSNHFLFPFGSPQLEETTAL